jgi:hypothetical protein
VEQVQREEREPEAEKAQAARVDLNRVFGAPHVDLNVMFPDEETRRFLQEIDRNRRSNLRFLEAFRKDKVWEDDE